MLTRYETEITNDLAENVARGNFHCMRPPFRDRGRFRGEEVINDKRLRVVFRDRRICKDELMMGSEIGFILEFQIVI